MSSKFKLEPGKKKEGSCPVYKQINIKKFFEILCSKIGSKCYEALEKLARGEISAREAFEIIKSEGIAKGITDEDIDKMIAEARNDG